MIRRYIVWRNRYATDERLADVVTRTNAVWLRPGELVPRMQEAPGVVKTIKSPAVHILRVRLGPRRQ
jgi:hypothetical protein